MNENLYKACGFFIEAMRLFEVSFIQSVCGSKKWDEEYFDRLKGAQQVAWRNREQMLDPGTNRMVLIDFDNLKAFVLGFKKELVDKGVLNPADASSMATWVEELHQTRNRLSHHNPIDDDEVSNAFYRMKKIAELLKMTELVAELDKIKGAKAAPVLTAVPAAAAPQPIVPPTVDIDTVADEAPIPAWFNTVTPHYDIRNGSLDESVFAANLNEVALGTGQEVYVNPTMFFEKTYITVGLRDIANRVITALNGEDTENRVISLQTGFGGGKTHSLISLYHIAKAGKDMLSSSYAAHILNSGVTPKYDNAKVAVFTNNTTDVAQGHILEDGTRISTLWGELAYQLCGMEGYRMLKDNDEKKIAPTADLFKKLLRECSPALLLIDELADYCTKAAAVKVGASTLSDQTIAFMQALTEAVSSVPKVVLITTLPASDTEVAGSAVGTKILSALEARVVRVGTSIKPVGDDEIFEVIRRRLFESIGDPIAIETVVQRYRKYYNKRGSELPQFVNNGTYPDLIRKSYPFHPEVINMFHHRWAQDSRFQRTRGVLRLLASIVKDLWDNRSTLTGSNGLIHTSDINLGHLQTLSSSITSLKGVHWDTVISADVTGTSSNSYRVDNADVTSDLYKYKITQGVATTVLLASIGGMRNGGLTMKELKLCMLRPASFNHSYIDNAVGKLEQVAHYLYSSSIQEKKLWFEARPNVNILLNQAKADVRKPAIDTEINNRLSSAASHLSNFSKILINPTPELQEIKNLTLAILSTDFATTAQLSNGALNRIKSISTLKGTSPRVYRNTLVFLLCTDHGLTILTDKVKDYLACRTILESSGTSLDPDQRTDLQTRSTANSKEIETALVNAYTCAVKYSAHDGATVCNIHPSASTFSSYLADDVFNALVDEEWILKVIGRGPLSDAGLYPTADKPVKVKEIYEAFLRYDDKPKITGPHAVEDCVAKYCKEGGFNVAYGQPGAWTDIKVKEHVFVNVEEDDVWIVDKNTVMPKPEKPEGPAAPGPATPGPEVPGPDVPPAVKTFKRITVSGSVAVDQWNDLYSSFVQTLRDNGLRVEVKFTATSNNALPLTENSQIYKSVKESASQLGLNLTEEE